VERLLDDITAAYDEHIQVPGKELHFLILIAFACCSASPAGAPT
jgi:hypothetical protein